MTEQELRQLYSKVCAAMGHVALYYAPSIQRWQYANASNGGICVSDDLSVHFRKREDVPKDHMCERCGNPTPVKEPKAISFRKTADELLEAVRKQFEEPEA